MGRTCTRSSGPVAPSPRRTPSKWPSRSRKGWSAIHEVGIIHRDLKTANIMRDGGGVVRVMDLGIAKKSHAEGTTGGTATGQLLGTPEYMSPEQIRGQRRGLPDRHLRPGNRDLRALRGPGAVSRCHPGRHHLHASAGTAPAVHPGASRSAAQPRSRAPPRPGQGARGTLSIGAGHARRPSARPRRVHRRSRPGGCNGVGRRGEDAPPRAGFATTADEGPDRGRGTGNKHRHRKRVTPPRPPMRLPGRRAGGVGSRRWPSPRSPPFGSRAWSEVRTHRAGPGRRAPHGAGHPACRSRGDPGHRSGGGSGHRLRRARPCRGAQAGQALWPACGLPIRCRPPVARPTRLRYRLFRRDRER